MQEDILMEYCTPRESLTFVAKIKLNASEEKIVKRVNRLLKKVLCY
jgi:ABC-type multidrug transport system ATPase subunit